MTQRLVAAACSLLLLAPLTALSQGKAGSSARVTIGKVERAERVRLDSSAGPGVLVGGTLGLLAGSGKSSGKKARNAIIGATAGGMVASSAQGSREGMSYTVRSEGGTLVRVISDQTGILIGDCVAVEEAGATANVRRLSAEACDKASQPVLASLEPEFRSEAAECAIAKDQLVNAKSNAEADLAIRKLKILCND
jgi:hypothetical protein